MCELLGIRHADGSLRPPSYDDAKDSPDTVREVRIKIAAGAEHGCWPAEG